MKLKYYLRGLGIGIITTTIIMLITFSGSKPTLSDNQIIERAKTLGMVMNKTASSNAKEEIPKGTESESENTQSTQAQTTESTEQKKTENSGKENNETENNGTKNQSDTTEAKTNLTQTDTSSQNSTQQTNQSVAFMIKSGDTSDSVATNLFKAGLIDDAQKFNQYLIKKGYDKKLRVGNYTIEKGESSDYQKILNSIIK